MKWRKLVSWAAATIGALACLSGAPVFGTVVANLGLEQMVHLSDGVAVGTVLTKQIVTLPDTGMTYTEYDFQVTAPVTGSFAAGRIVRLRFPGGSDGRVVAYVAGTPSFKPGEEALVFLSDKKNGYFGVVGWELGRFAVERDPNGAVLARRSRPSTGVAVMGAPEGTPLPDAVPLDAFIADIQRIAAERPPARTEVKP